MDLIKMKTDTDMAILRLEYKMDMIRFQQDFHDTLRDFRREFQEMSRDFARNRKRNLDRQLAPIYTLLNTGLAASFALMAWNVYCSIH